MVWAMKIVPLNEAKARLSHYGRQCVHEPIIVTVNGSPAFELVPLSKDDDLLDQLMAHNPDFKSLLRQRLGERPQNSKGYLGRP